jgi:hypothetical protein
VTTVSSWELAARQFEASRHLWSIGAWRAYIEADDRLRVEGPTSSIGFTFPGVNLLALRPDGRVTPPEDTRPAAAREVVYHPYGSAAELMVAQEDEVVAAGPAGTGKSMANLWRIHVLAMLYPGSRFLIVRKTARSLASTGLVTFREQVVPASKAAGVVHWYGGSQEKPAAYEYVNGSEVVVGGLDNSDKIMSSDYDAVFVQEATELKLGDWEALLTRLRHGVTAKQQLLADCNPSFPQHWLKKRCDAGTTRMIHCRHEDNPSLFDPGTGELTLHGATYMGKLDSLTGVRYQRLRKGRWVAAEGVIYEEWDDALHLVDRPQPEPLPDDMPPRDRLIGETLPLDWPRLWSVDFGFTNPFVCQCWALDGDGRLYLEWEVYRTRRMVEEHAVTILDQVSVLDPRYVHRDSGRSARVPRPHLVRARNRSIICDHDSEGRALLAKELGIVTKAARKNVTGGIQAVQKGIKPRRRRAAPPVPAP